jgi:3-polyprenyl-4-hydroxybenzoate decarboxylase
MMEYEGLRDWLSIIEQRGELTTLEDVDWNLEMGAVVDVLYREHPPYPPALIFDRIKDHKPGYRALFGHFASPQRIGLTIGVEGKFDHVLQFTRMYHEKIKACVPLPRIEVKSGPVQQNVQQGRSSQSARFSRAIAARKRWRPLFGHRTSRHNQRS